MSICAVLFDLDGTLADTAPDLGGALNHLLERHRREPLPLEVIRPYSGMGANGLIQLGFNLRSSHEVPVSLRDEYLHLYAENLHQNTCLFDGVNEMLQTLRAKHIAWGIITNKASRYTEALLPHLAFSDLPDIVLSGDSLDEAKPSPKPLLYAAEQLGFCACDCIYVGDAQRDIQAGNAAQMHTVFARWGYWRQEDQPETWGATWQINHISELSQYLN